LASGLSVAFALITSLVQVSWNYLPLSGADAALKAMLFCLVWADCGSVWSVDAWIARRRGRGDTSDATYVIAPLRLIRFQIALIYFNAGLWKLMNPYWRDGTAAHYVVESNVYHRFPFPLPVSDALLTALTYGTLLWELTFAPLLLFRTTRRVALAVGILLHLGMLATIEIGPFHFVMLAGYLAFLNPRAVPGLPRRLWTRKKDTSVADTDIHAVRSS